MKREKQMQNHWITIVVSVLLAAAALTAWSGFAEADAPRPGNANGHHADEPGGFEFQMLVDGLRSTPGCLGVEVAQFQSGKLSIFAWFENKNAALRWYHHPIHRGAMRAMFPHGAGSPEGYQPLAHITNENEPLLVIATITPNREAAGGDHPLAQISIEHYQPQPGGLAIGGRLTPQSVEVPHMNLRETF